MAKKRIDISGVRFGKLVATEYAGQYQSPSRPHSMWKCVCDCGNEHIARLNTLRSGGTVSCGCMKKSGDRTRKHGDYGSDCYLAWARIKTRCFNQNSQDFPMYGGRGIQMHDEWASSYESFRDHVGERPSALHSIDRIDNSKGYVPGNVRWATADVQSRNKRSNVFYEMGGLRMCQSDWASHIGITVSALIQRVEEWGVEKALSTPKRKSK